MKPTKNPAWTEAVRGLGRSASLEDLQRRGVRKVRAVPVAKVADIIEHAVIQTLAERTPDLEEEQRRELVHEATRRTLRLMRLHREILGRTERLADYRAELVDAAEQVAGEVTSAVDRDILERRLRKVTAYLEETDQAIHAALQAIETLLPSTHHRSEGVEADDPQRERKERMLTQMFQSNEDIRGPNGPVPEQG